ncbi:MAG: YezD family protein [Verrucomicrobia bacterium]|nr:YezD family protein [Verrucomicrobiota bacterium]
MSGIKKDCTTKNNDHHGRIKPLSSMTQKNLQNQAEIVSMEGNRWPRQAKDWLHVIEEQARGLRFGSIGITIHDGRVVQIETSSKVRFDRKELLDVPGYQDNQ